MIFLKNIFWKPYNPSEKIDFFWIHKKWIQSIGMWSPKVESNNGYFAFFIKALRLIYKLFVIIILLKMAALFTISTYFDIVNGSFAEISYSLSQTILSQFSFFVIFYFQFRTDTCFRMMNFINDNFKYRSAKGSNKFIN